jgi:predicted nucleic acid-binding protein
MQRDEYYWDANAFLGVLKGETDKAPVCKLVLKAASNGTVVIVTSALTLAEVLFVKHQGKLDISTRQTVENFFKADYISVRNVTRQTADLARDLFWDFKIDPKDALHVATALIYKVPVLHTYDDSLISKSGLVINGQTLKISKPEIIHQTDWVDDGTGSNNEKPPH